MRNFTPWQNRYRLGCLSSWLLWPSLTAHWGGWGQRGGGCWRDREEPRRQLLSHPIFPPNLLHWLAAHHVALPLPLLQLAVRRGPWWPFGQWHGGAPATISPQKWQPALQLACKICCLPPGFLLFPNYQCCLSTNQLFFSPRKFICFCYHAHYCRPSL